MEDKALKKTSFDLFEADIEAIKAYRTEHNCSPAEAISALISAARRDSTAADLGEYRQQLDNAKGHLDRVYDMLAGAFSDNKTLAETIRTEFQKDLESKDESIRNLQEQLRAAKETVSAAQAEKANAEKTAGEISKQAHDQAEKDEKEIKRLHDLNVQQAETIATQKQAHDTLMQSFGNLQAQILEFQEKADSYDELEEQLNAEKAAHSSDLNAAEVQRTKDIAETERTIRAELKTEIDHLHEKIDTLRAENGDLKQTSGRVKDLEKQLEKSEERLNKAELNAEKWEQKYNDLIIKYSALVEKKEEKE